MALRALAWQTSIDHRADGKVVINLFPWWERVASVVTTLVLLAFAGHAIQASGMGAMSLGPFAVDQVWRWVVGLMVMHRLLEAFESRNVVLDLSDRTFQTNSRLLFLKKRAEGSLDAAGSIEVGPVGRHFAFWRFNVAAVRLVSSSEDWDIELDRFPGVFEWPRNFNANDRVLALASAQHWSSLTGMPIADGFPAADPD